MVVVEMMTVLLVLMLMSLVLRALLLTWMFSHRNEDCVWKLELFHGEQEMKNQEQTFRHSHSVQ